ncbi:hypothetical protein [Salinibacter ruber]|jgi:hypothetical protein|uniref:Uncharacterized protein n=1 Tax=Salinibacter ruber TaxID=146919 RepID=A0A9X2QB92_9BACT|nr:hypothetical protein [Salinibacter ruber]MCS3662319.1 hypothetical protein [Salinibacter ruber]MCS3712103.1 hypothetical protein [Salinibacter ruber]
MQLPLIPDSEETFTVKEYPSHREIQALIKVQLRNRTLTDEAKERLREEYEIPDSFDPAEAGMLGRYEAELAAARVVFQEEIPDSVDPLDISSKAVGQATEVFLGVAAPQAGGQVGEMLSML